MREYAGLAPVGVLAVEGAIPSPAERKLSLIRQLEAPFQIGEAEEALERVHLYFRVRAGRVIESEEAVVLLGQLVDGPLTRENGWKEVDLAAAAVPLALLAAAAFCEVDPDCVSISGDGRTFLAHLAKK